MVSGLEFRVWGSRQGSGKDFLVFLPGFSERISQGLRLKVQAVGRHALRFLVQGILGFGFRVVFFINVYYFGPRSVVCSSSWLA